MAYSKLSDSQLRTLRELQAAPVGMSQARLSKAKVCPSLNALLRRGLISVELVLIGPRRFERFALTEKGRRRLAVESFARKCREEAL